MRASGGAGKAGDVAGRHKQGGRNDDTAHLGSAQRILVGWFNEQRSLCMFPFYLQAKYPVVLGPFSCPGLSLSGSADG
jgi:hypothetical protein